MSDNLHLQAFDQFKINLQGSFPASILFQSFDTDEDIIDKTIEAYQECVNRFFSDKEAAKRIKHVIILWLFKSWNEEQNRNKHPNFPYLLWKEIVSHNWGSHKSEPSLLIENIQKYREKGLDELCKELINTFINDEEPSEHLKWLEELKNNAHSALKGESPNKYSWEKEDYYHLCCLLDDRNLDYKLVCAQLEKEKEEFRKSLQADKSRLEDNPSFGNEVSQNATDEASAENQSATINEQPPQDTFSEEASNQKKDIIFPLETDDDIQEISEYTNYKAAKKLIKQYHLPTWLDEQLKQASQQQSTAGGSNVQSSCDGTDTFWKVNYQIRYFPRTLCETFFIFDQAFKHSEAQFKENINILSLGCGSGGDIIGLLMAIEANFEKKVKVSIVAYEINDNAYQCFLNNLEQAKKTLKKVEVVNNVARKNDPILLKDDERLQVDKSTHFDYVLCSKMVNEIMRGELKDAVSKWDGETNFKQIIINLQNNRFNTIYRTLLEEVTPVINDNGYCLISDLTDKPTPKELVSIKDFSTYCRYSPFADQVYPSLHRCTDKQTIFDQMNEILRFIPAYLNLGVKSFIGNNQTFRPILPWGCDGCWSGTACFTQLQFYIHNPALTAVKDRFEGLCFKLLKKETRVNGTGTVKKAVKLNIDHKTKSCSIRSCDTDPLNNRLTEEEVLLERAVNIYKYQK